MVIQSVIIPKSKFTEKEATEWILDHDFSTKGKRIKNYKTTEFYRFRQKPPSHFVKDSIRTMVKKKGIQFIVGKLK